MYLITTMSKLLKTKHPRQFTPQELFLDSANINFNSQCNGCCLYCTGKVTDERHMSLEKAKELMKVAVSDLRLRNVYLGTLAEITLWPHMVELMKSISTLEHNMTTFSFDTNARFIPEGLFEQLNSAVDWEATVSLWGYDAESWQRCQGKGGWSRTVRNIARYLTEMQKAPGFYIVAVDEKQAEKTFDFIAELCRSNGRQYAEIANDSMWQQKALRDTGVVPIMTKKLIERCPDGIERVHKMKSDEYMDFKTNNTCTYLYKQIVVDAQGFVYPCAALSRNKAYAIGNINSYDKLRKEDLYRMMHTPKAQEFWISNFEPGKMACGYCKYCTLKLSI